jgi:hypothetical protein
LEDKGYKLAEEKARGILNETKGEYLLWLRWQRQAVGGSAMRAIPLLIDDGYSTGGGGTDIAVIYDPKTGTLILWIVPSDLVRFIECVAECALEVLGPEGIIVLILAFRSCLETCERCWPISIYLLGLWAMYSRWDRRSSSIRVLLFFEVSRIIRRYLD